MSLLTGARVVTPDGVLDPGWVLIEDGRIAAVGSGTGHGPGTDLGGGWLVPGFIDLHVHGGGGHDSTTSPDALAAGVAYHFSCGTTRTLVSLMTAPVDALLEQLKWVTDAVRHSVPLEGRVVGAHLEGPFLSSARCGAQNAAHLLDPDPAVLATLLEAADGAVRTITVAPELPGALDLIREIVRSGAIAAIGHTDATYEQAAAGFAAGATLATHLFNAMGELNQRAPGAAVAALDGSAGLELINDGVHVHDALTRLVLRNHGARVALITDAISATGAGDGDYLLGGQSVVAHGDTVRVRISGRLAGSTLTMDAAMRRVVVDLGLPITLAVAAASTTPARLLGLGDRCGAITTGLDADLVHLDDDLQVVRVMASGDWAT